LLTASFALALVLLPGLGPLTALVLLAPRAFVSALLLSTLLLSALMLAAALASALVIVLLRVFRFLSIARHIDTPA
jgi:hypothetical protein